MGIVSQAITYTDKMGDHELLDLEEWALVLNKMLKFHYNISEEIKALVQAIRTEMKPELIPLAEDEANFGKLVKSAIRQMWSLEYEVDELQSKFADSIGKMDLDNLDVDFIEDMMLKSKPLQSVLNDIRNRQKAKLEDIRRRHQRSGAHESFSSPQTCCPRRRPCSRRTQGCRRACSRPCGRYCLNRLLAIKFSIIINSKNI